jgi:hypothetical protein
MGNHLGMSAARPPIKTADYSDVEKTAAAERERCAKICERLARQKFANPHDGKTYLALIECADLILKSAENE